MNNRALADALQTSLAKKISKTSLNDHKEDSHEASRNFSHFV